MMRRNTICKLFLRICYLKSFRCVFACDPHSIPESGIWSHPVLENQIAGEKLNNQLRQSHTAGGGRAESRAQRPGS